MTGGCQCRRIRYQVWIDSDEACLCHCKMCRHATGGASIAFVSVPLGAIAWDVEPDWYRSSPIAERPFCSTCGTPLGFRFVEGAATMDVTVGSFDDPSRFKPVHNYAAESILTAWQDTAHLPGIRSDENVNVVERWRKAVASSPTDFPIRRFTSDDDVQLAYREIGAGRPLILIHGLFSNGWVNWIRYGHAQLLADAGFRVIMPDLRGHGESAAPHDASAYPPDILAADGEALIQYLGLSDYDLGGYSLGGRTVLRMLVRGATPRRAIVSGMGLEGMLDAGKRSAFFRNVLLGIGTHERGSAAWTAEAFLKTTGGDARAMLPLLDSFLDTTRDAIGAVTVSTLVLTGVDDRDNGSAAELAAALRAAKLVEIPGNHMTSVLRPELGDEMRKFLLTI